MVAEATVADTPSTSFQFLFTVGLLRHLPLLGLMSHVVMAWFAWLYESKCLRKCQVLDVEQTPNIDFNSGLLSCGTARNSNSKLSE